MMVKLANKLFNSGKINIFVDILKTYKNNITIKDVELFIKIDKTYDFNLFTTKQKKVIEKLL